MTVFDLLPDEHLSFSASGRSILCFCTTDPLVPSYAPDDRRFDWFVSLAGVDRWAMFSTEYVFSPVGAELEDGLLARDHRWRIELVGRPLGDILDDPATVANLQSALLARVDHARIPKLRKASGDQVARVSGLLRPVEVQPVVPTMPRDPKLRRVTVDQVLSAAHAGRLRRCGVRTLVDAEHCTRAGLLALPGVGGVTVSALENALLAHGATLAVRGRTDRLVVRARDSRAAFRARVARGETVAQIACELGLSTKYVRGVILGDAG